MGEVRELQKFDSEITMCCNLLITQEKSRGWEAGIRAESGERSEPVEA